MLPFNGDHSFSNVLSHGNSVGVFINDLSAITNKETLRMILDMFSILAMLTSIIGVAIGLFDYIAESLKYQFTKFEKIKTIIFTFGIPLIFSVYYPSGFILALNFAAIALVILAIVFPAVIALRTRKNYIIGQYKVLGGDIMLYLAVIIGMFLVMLRLSQFL